MTIAALVSFAILLIAWIGAPSTDRRPVRHEATEPISLETAPRAA